MANATWWKRSLSLLGRIFVVEPGGSPEPRSGNGHPSFRTAAGSDLSLAHDKWMDSGKTPLDPSLRVALALIEQGDPVPVFERTGIVLPGGPGQQPTDVFLPLHIEVTQIPTQALLNTLQSELSLTVPKVWAAEAGRNPSLRGLTAQMKVHVDGKLMIDVDTLRTRLLAVIDHPLISRVSLATPMDRCDAGKFGETLADFGMPAQRKVSIGGHDYTADGKGVVIGIIDDGCSYAHWNFLRDGPASRIAYIWDQGRPKPSPIWTAPPDQLYGYELINTSVGGPPPIDAALKKHTGANGVIDEDAVYDEIEFPPYGTVEFRPFIASTHGTHVMDIAAGNGRGLFSREGVAPAADIIFVQLPRERVFEGGPALSQCIADGAAYVFERAKQLEAALGKPVPAVVNVSYGNYVGPHDGSSLMETTFDYLLAVPDRAIVVSAGNGFAAHCHAKGKVTASTPASLHWLVQSFNESMSLVEIWYTGPSDIAFYLTPPGATQPLGPVRANDPRTNIVDASVNKNNVGYIDHVGPYPGNDDNLISITLNATSDRDIAQAQVAPLNAPKAVNAPSGTWVITLKKPTPLPGAKASKPARFHAWIERNESSPGDPVRRRQSRFADDEAHPKFTVTGYATGMSTIAVGAYKTATAEMAEYSACGPSRPSTKSPQRRTKPEICAPASGDARGRGVLSASTRFALDSRMGGTSASAPHVAGLAALVLQLNRDVNQALGRVKPLPIAKLRTLLVDGALAGRHLLRQNAHQWVDEHQPYKQRFQSIWKYLKGNGAVNAGETLKRVK